MAVIILILTARDTRQGTWPIECRWALTRRASQKLDRDCIIVSRQLALRKAKGAMQRCAAVGHARAACDATEVLTQDLQQRHYDVQCMRNNLNQEHG